MSVDLQQFGAEEFCYLTTRGRRTGKAHVIEIWFGLDGATLYMLAGGREGADWVKNIVHDPAVTVRIREQIFAGAGRVLPDDGAESVRARELVGPKYDEWQPGQPHTGWTWTALAVAVDLQTA